MHKIFVSLHWRQADATSYGQHIYCFILCLLQKWMPCLYDIYSPFCLPKSLSYGYLTCVLSQISLFYSGHSIFNISPRLHAFSSWDAPPPPFPSCLSINSRGEQRRGSECPSIRVIYGNHSRFSILNNSIFPLLDAFSHGKIRLLIVIASEPSFASDFLLTWVFKRQTALFRRRLGRFLIYYVPHARQWYCYTRL